MGPRGVVALVAAIAVAIAPLSARAVGPSGDDVDDPVTRKTLTASSAPDALWLGLLWYREGAILWKRNAYQARTALKAELKINHEKEKAIAAVSKALELRPVVTEEVLPTWLLPTVISGSIVAVLSVVLAYLIGERNGEASAREGARE